MHNDAQQTVILVFGFALLIACLAAFAIYSDEEEIAPDVPAQPSAEKVKVMVDCPECHGTGMRIEEGDPEFLPGIYLEVNGECPMCGGSGKLIKESDR